MFEHRPHDLLHDYRAARSAGLAPPRARSVAIRQHRDRNAPLMLMVDYAPGPWQPGRLAEPDAAGFADAPIEILCNRGHVVAAVSPDAPATEANATAARITECINAFRGIIHPAEYLAHLKACARMLEEYTR